MNSRDEEIIMNTIAYQTYNKRYGQLSKEELREYNRIRKQASRNRNKEERRMQETLYMREYRKRRKLLKNAGLNDNQ